jgi:hypothetical protein
MKGTTQSAPPDFVSEDGRDGKERETYTFGNVGKFYQNKTIFYRYK